MLTSRSTAPSPRAALSSRSGTSSERSTSGEGSILVLMKVKFQKLTVISACILMQSRLFQCFSDLGELGHGSNNKKRDGGEGGGRDVLSCLLL
jgi:hypothetical protein